MPATRRPRRPRTLIGRRVGVALSAVLATVAAGLAAPANAYVGAGWFQPDRVYTQNFPDPSVLRVGNTYYAYATGTGGSYLPIMRSTDEQTWVARPAYDPNPGPNSLLTRYPGFNDGLPWVAPWGVKLTSGTHMSSWVTAPGVARFGDTYNAYYGLLQTAPDKACIAVATSSSPEGPFLNPPGMTTPLVCEGRAPGSFDPQPFIDPATGQAYLVWAGEGPAAAPPSKIWSRPLAPDGLSFTGPARPLIATDQPWEGPIIENPSMVRYQGKLYLLYSGNSWWTADYAVGYAECDTPLGPCRKPRTTPLLTSNGVWQGPGGASAFLEQDGRLKIAYHHWNAPWVGYPTNPNCDGNGHCTSQGQRRMSIGELSDTGAGLELGAPPPTASAASAGTTWLGGRAADGSANLVSVAPDGTRSAPLQLGGYVVGTPAVVAGPNGALAVVARGPDNAVYVTSRPDAGSPFTGWGSLGGYVTSRPVAASWSAGRLDVVARGGDGQVWHRPQVSPGQWLPWQPLGGGVKDMTAPALTAPSPDRLVLSVVGWDRQAWTRTWDGSTWTPWGPTGGNVTGDVALASPQPGVAVLAVRGADDTGWQATLRTVPGGWTTSGFGPLGGVLSSTPAVAAVPGSGRTEVLIVGVDGAAWRQVQTSAGGSWSGWRRN